MYGETFYGRHTAQHQLQWRQIKKYIYKKCKFVNVFNFQTPIASTVYKGNFFPQTIRDWNALPDSLSSYAEDAEDCVAMFISLVRVRD